MLFFNRKRNFEQLSDVDLVQLYKEKDDLEIVGFLFKRHQHLVISIAFKYSKNEAKAEDAAMEVFEILTNDLKHTEVTNFKGWLFSVVKNHCLKQIRKDNREGKMIDQFTYFMENEDEIALSNKTINEARLDELENCIGELKDEQRICIELFYLKKNA